MKLTLFTVALSLLSAGTVSAQAGFLTTQDLKAYYPFNGNANDASGNGHHGTAFGNPTLVADRSGAPNAAYQFDGINDYINTFSTFDYPDRTVSLWIKPFSTSGTGTNASRIALTQDDAALANGILRVDITSNQLNLWSGGNNNAVYQTSNVSVNQWYHLVLVRKGGSTPKNEYYINGTLVGFGPANSYGSTSGPNSQLIIGAGRSTIYQFFHGVIDDVAIYNKPATAFDVTQLFNGQMITGVQESLSQTSVVTINIYPNPNQGSFQLELTNSFKNSSIKTVKIVDQLGRVVYSKEFSNTTYKADLQNQPAGVYTVLVNTADEVLTKKLIIAK